MDMTPFVNDRTGMDVGLCVLWFRLTDRVVIPKYIELSHFITEELGASLDKGSQKRYRLVFYSTVCHRGQYIHSGHYVSIIWDRQNEMCVAFVVRL